MISLMHILYLLIVISYVQSIPTTQQSLRLGSDEIRITPFNRDVCLAKLLCGMSAVSIQQAYTSGQKDGEIYGDYAQIVGKFFQENPSDEFDDYDGGSGNLEESFEALEDYSVSSEYDDEEVEEIEPVKLFSQNIKLNRPSSQTHRRKPASYPSKRKPTTTTTTVPPKKLTPAKTTPPGIQIFYLGMPVQEGAPKPQPARKSRSRMRRKWSTRISRARKILKTAGLETKLRTVRQCQRINGCNYSFRQLYQKYGGKKIFDDVSQPNQPLPVVEELPSRQPQLEHEIKQFSVQVKGQTKGPLENPWISPPQFPTQTTITEAKPFSGSVQQNFEYGGVDSEKIHSLDAFYQPALTGAEASKFSNPGSTYKIKKSKPFSQLANRLTIANLLMTKKKKKSTTTTTTTTTTTEATTTTTTTEPTTTSTTTTTTTPPPRRSVHYKRPVKRPEHYGDDDDDENINRPTPIKLIGHHEHDFDDEAVDKKNHQVEYENSNESVDDYDEEEKYHAPVDYGNDDVTDELDDEDDDDEEDAKPIRKRRPRPPKAKPNKRKQKPALLPLKNIKNIQEKNDEVRGPATKFPGSGRPFRHKPIDSTKKFTEVFQSVQTGNLKNLKKRKPTRSKPKQSGSSEEKEDDEIFDEDDDSEPPPFQYPMAIGGRPIFPEYDVPVTAFGMTRSTMPIQPNPKYSTGSGHKRRNSKPNSDGTTFLYPYTASGDGQEQEAVGNPDGMGFDPILSSGVSVFSPIKSLFKHLSSGVSPNPVGGGMGYSQSQPPNLLHYTQPPSGNPHGITVPLGSEDLEDSQVPQIAIMPQIPVGPESSKYKRPENKKYTINKTKRIPTLRK